MKMCITATDLSEHYENEHVGMETRRMELRERPAVTVGLVYLAAVAGLWDVKGFPFRLHWCGPLQLFWKLPALWINEIILLFCILNRRQESKYVCPNNVSPVFFFSDLRLPFVE